MKKIISTLFSLVFTIVLFAQQAPPQGINYQAMVYVPYGNQQVGVNSAGQIPANTQQVVVKFTLEEGNNGPVIYEETHTDTTDQYGLLNTVIGTGTPTSNSPGLFNQIDWSLGDPYLRVSITLTQYNSTVSSYQKLWSVPYALYAGHANTADFSTNSAHADSSDYADLAGNGITGVTDNGDGTLTFNYLDGSSYTTDPLTGLGSVGPQGPAGANGQSAYDLWLAQGNTGTQQDFLNSLQGATGAQGPIGLTGPQGATGPAGPQGTPGSQNAWSLTGNAGTNPTTNFIGTTDAQDWVIKTNNTERMRVTSAGNVGIGTSSPAWKFQVGNASNNGFIALQGDATNGNLLRYGGTGTNAGILRFVGQSDIESMRIADNGNVGIGTSNPQGLLSLNRQTSSTGIGTFEANGMPQLIFNDFDYSFITGFDEGLLIGTNLNNYINAMSTNSQPQAPIYVANYGKVGFNTFNPDQILSVNGNASKAGGGSWATFSDGRVKHDIKPFNDGLNVLMKLNPVTFKYNEKSGYTDVNKTFVGFLAQDVEKVAPYMVNLYDDSNGPSGLSDKRQFDESALNKILVNAVQEQQAQIDQLKKELEEMKSILKELKKD